MKTAPPHNGSSMYLDEFKHQLPDIDPARDRRLDRLARRGRRAGGRDPGPVPALQAAQARPPAPGRAAAADQHPLHQHDQPGAGAGLPGRRGARAAHPPADPLERRRDGPAREQQVHRDRRPPRDVRLGGDPLRGRLQLVLPGPRGRGGPGDQIFYQGHAAPGIYARAFLEGRIDRGPARPLPARDAAAATACRSYPHPRLMPDFWEFPTVSMGLGPIDAIYQARFNRYLQNRGLARHVAARASGPSSATARPTSPRRSARSTSPPRGPRQPDLRRQLQPPAPRRPGPRQRQDHPGARGRLPRLGLERHQGHLGPRVGRAPRPRRRRRPRREDEHDRRRRVPEVLGRRRGVHPRALLRARIRGSGRSSST